MRFSLISFAFIVLISLVVVLYNFIYPRMPTEEEISIRLKDSVSSQDFSIRKSNYLALIDIMSKGSHSKNDDLLIEKTVDSLLKHFIASKDDALFQALSDYPMTGGFANVICGKFYLPLLNEESIKTLKLKNVASKRAFKRCSGIVYNDEILDRLFEHGT